MLNLIVNNLATCGGVPVVPAARQGKVGGALVPGV